MGPAVGLDGDDSVARRTLGDGSGLARGLLETPKRDVVGVGIAGPLAGLGPHPGALAHVAGGLLDGALLEQELFDLGLDHHFPRINQLSALAAGAPVFHGNDDRPKTHLRPLPSWIRL